MSVAVTAKIIAGKTILPCSAKVKTLINDAINHHRSAIETFYRAYRTFMEEKWENWEERIASANTFDELTCTTEQSLWSHICSDDIGLMLTRSEFDKWCNVVRKALRYKVSPTTAKRSDASMGFLQEVQTYAQKKFGIVNESSMEQSFAVCNAARKKQSQYNKENKQRFIAESEGEVGVTSVVSPAEESDIETRTVQFTAKVGGKRAKSKDDTISPYGLLTTHQEEDFEKLSEQFVITLRNWFNQPGILEYMNGRSEYARTLKKVYKIISDN